MALLTLTFKALERASKKAWKIPDLILSTMKSII